MPVPILAVVPTIIGAVAKVGSKIGGFFKKLFGGKKRRKAARLADKQQRIEDSAKRVMAIKLAKLEEAANVGEAKAGVKLAKIERALARQGINFDPGVQDANLDDLKFNIPQMFRKDRLPQVFQTAPFVESDPGLGVGQQRVLSAQATGLNLEQFFSKPINILLVLLGVLLLFGRRLFK